VATALYRLTPHGDQLRPIIAGLARWGAPELQRGVAGDSFRPRWLVLAIDAIFDGVNPDDLAPLRARLVIDGDTVDLVADGEGVTAELHAGTPADVTIATDPETAMQLLTAQITPRQARHRRSATLQGPSSASDKLATLAQRAAGARRNQAVAVER